MYVKDIPSTHLELEKKLKQYHGFEYMSICMYNMWKKPHKLLIIFSQFGLIEGVRLDHKRYV